MQEKYDAISLLVQNKLDTIADIISQTVQDGDISSSEFKVLQDVENNENLILLLENKLNKDKTYYKRTARRTA